MFWVLLIYYTNLEILKIMFTRYSDSVLDRATVDCFLEFQLIKFPPKKMYTPDTDLRSSISIGVALKTENFGWMKGKAIMNGALDVAKKSFTSCPMSKGGCMKKLTELIDCISNVKTCVSKIL